MAASRHDGGRRGAADRRSIQAAAAGARVVGAVPAPAQVDDAARVRVPRGRRVSRLHPHLRILALLRRPHLQTGTIRCGSVIRLLPLRLCAIL